MATPGTAAGTVVAYFSTEAQALNAVEALQTAGFDSSQIGVALSRPTTFDQRTGSGEGTLAQTTRAKGESAWDRFKGMFGVGETSGGVEPYADERRLNPASSHEITSPEAYNYEHGDVSHSLSGMSVPEDRSRYFGHRIGRGEGAVVTVRADGREAEAEQILTSQGGDLGAAASSYDYDTAPQVTEGKQRIELLGEVLRVHKDRVGRGEVRIRKETITEQQTVQVPVTREELVIERTPVSDARAASGEVGSNQEIRIPLTEERASLDKQTVVREQVNVGKRSIEEVENLEGSVRHEELQVEDETRRR